MVSKIGQLSHKDLKNVESLLGENTDGGPWVSKGVEKKSGKRVCKMGYRGRLMGRR